MSLLDSIKTPADVRALPAEQLAGIYKSVQAEIQASGYDSHYDDRREYEASINRAETRFKQLSD